MRDLTCTLLSHTLSSDSIGVETETTTELVVPIIKIEDIYANEFYQANEQGYQPTLRLRISTLNYNGESELVYMGETYSVIRTQDLIDETILVCERKLKYVNQTRGTGSISV